MTKWLIDKLLTATTYLFLMTWLIYILMGYETRHYEFWINELRRQGYDLDNMLFLGPSGGFVNLSWEVVFGTLPVVLVVIGIIGVLRYFLKVPRQRHKSMEMPDHRFFW